MMQRYFLDEYRNIQKDDIRHIKTVMRMTTGDLIEVCMQDGACFLASIKIDENGATYEIKEPLSNEKSTHHVILFQGIGKGEKNEFVIKYATQFGVDEIIFVQMKRSIAKMDQADFLKKKERYDKIALESARLAHRNDVPKLAYLNHLKQINPTFDHAFVAFENDRKTTFLEKIETLKPTDCIALLIGPEGGIDDSEMALLKDKGFVSVGLGKRILQTEVACLYGLALIDGILERKR